MRYKLIITWAFVLIITSLIGLIFINYPLIVNAMIPVEIIAASSIIPLVYIDKRMDSNRELKLKNKVKKKGTKSRFNKNEVQSKELDLLKSNKKPYFKKAVLDSPISIVESEEDIDLILGDVKIHDSLIKSENSLDIIKRSFPNKDALEIVSKDESLEDIIKELKGLDLSFFTNQFFESLDDFEWKDDNELLDFVKDMMNFSPSERSAIIDDMRSKSVYK